MADPARARKLADRIRVVVAETLERRIKDPRLGFVTITDARVTGDLQNASVYYTVYGGEDEQASTAAALESAKGVLRSEVGRRTGIRLTPTLEFFLDAVPETAAAMEALLARAAEQDARVAALALGAQHAGEADPYRHPAEDDEDQLDDDAPDASAAPGAPDPSGASEQRSARPVVAGDGAGETRTDGSIGVDGGERA